MLADYPRGHTPKVTTPPKAGTVLRRKSPWYGVDVQEFDQHVPPGSMVWVTDKPAAPGLMVLISASGFEVVCGYAPTHWEVVK